MGGGKAAAASASDSLCNFSCNVISCNFMKLHESAVLRFHENLSTLAEPEDHLDATARWHPPYIRGASTGLSPFRGPLDL